MTFDEAADIVDLYGPDPTFWPRAERDALESMIASDEDFARYVERAKWLDDMLSNWDEEADWDGVEFDDEDEEGEDEGQNDEGEGDAPNEGVGVRDDHAGGEAPDEEDEEIVIEVNPDRLEDMDKMFSDAIQKAFTNADPAEFRVFTRDYDEMVEIDGVDEQVSIEGIDQAVARSTGPLQKDLRRLIAARSQVKRVPGTRRGRLHAPNLHRILSGDDRVFTRREEAQSLDTAISLVIDCSGSMAGSKMQLATETAYAIGSVLNRLGVTFECLGFTCNSSDPRTRSKTYLAEVEAAHAIAPIIRSTPIVMPKFKLFDERWNQPVQRRFARVFNAGGGYDCGFSYGSTPEGCGMEFAARRLIGRKEARKIMIVMTDGEPGGQCYDYNTPGATWAYKKQSEDMVKSIEAAGVDLIGVGIKHAGPERYYSNSMVIQNLSEMPAQLMGLLKKFILGK